MWYPRNRNHVFSATVCFLLLRFYFGLLFFILNIPFFVGHMNHIFGNYMPGEACNWSKILKCYHEQNLKLLIVLFMWEKKNVNTLTETRTCTRTTHTHTNSIQIKRSIRDWSFHIKNDNSIIHRRFDSELTIFFAESIVTLIQYRYCVQMMITRQYQDILSNNHHQHHHTISQPLLQEQQQNNKPKNVYEETLTFINWRAIVEHSAFSHTHTHTLYSLRVFIFLD